MKKRGAIGVGFNWIFAMIVGAIILFIALYFASKVIGVGETQAGTESAARLVSVFDPLETGLALEKSLKVDLKRKTKIEFSCDSSSNRPFGRQRLRVAEKGFGSDYGEWGYEVSLNNKYVFSDKIIEGENFYIFSQAFFMGFKVSDINIMGSEDYCFYQAPNRIKRDIQNLGVDKFRFTESLSDSDLKNCSGRLVCFESENNKCDMIVKGECNDLRVCEDSYDYGRVLKNGGQSILYYADSLVYGAIFSGEDIYECNVIRIMNRLSELSDIYRGKADLLQGKGCRLNIGDKIRIMQGFVDGEISSNNFDSSDLINVHDLAREADLMNKGARGECEVY
ncbi:hypothetical protein HOC86_01660 [archaeon]|jgi:hypothetical protein|nr:hypothetical protein [archaeon]